MNDKLTIKGSFWSAGDNIYVDVWTPEDGWKCVCINDLLKDNIPQNRIVEIEVTLVESER